MNALFARYLEVILKLENDEPLNKGERIWTARALKLAHDVLFPPKPDAPGRKRQDDRHEWIALHYTLLKAKIKAGDAQEVVRLAWGLETKRTVTRIEQAQRAQCKELLAKMTDHEGLLEVCRWHADRSKTKSISDV